MVIVKNAHLRKGQDDKEFVTLELNGDIELIQSQNTGRFYATVRRSFISTTFDLPTAKMFIGKTLPGQIIRQECEPYEFTIPDTGEVVTLNYSYQYSPETKPQTEAKPVISQQKDADTILAELEAMA